MASTSRARKPRKYNMSNVSKIEDLKELPDFNLEEAMNEEQTILNQTSIIPIPSINTEIQRNESSNLRYQNQAPNDMLYNDQNKSSTFGSPGANLIEGNNNQANFNSTSSQRHDNFPPTQYGQNFIPYGSANTGDQSTLQSGVDSRGYFSSPSLQDNTGSQA